MWKEIEEFEHGSLWLAVFFAGDKPIRVAPAIEGMRESIAFQQHYGIDGMTFAGFLLVNEGDSRERIAVNAARSVERAMRYEADHASWRAANPNAGSITSNARHV